MRILLFIFFVFYAQAAGLVSPVQNCRFEPHGGKDYQRRVHPITGQVHWHSGVDLVAPEGTPYLAPGDGVVTKAGFANSRCGYMIEIKHGPNLYSHSCHMKQGGFPSGIRPGVEIKKGQKVAEVGNTGGSRGPHAHFVVKTTPGFSNHMDPYIHVDNFCGVSRQQARGSSGRSNGAQPRRQAR